MKHPNVVEFLVHGDNALFSDPLMRVGGEKCTMQIPTYEALKGVVSAIYWKPTFTWVIDAVRIMKPIQTEVKGVKIPKYNDASLCDLANYTYLHNCVYQVRAHFEWNMNRPEFEKDRNENKQHNIAKRAVAMGGRRSPFLGASECQAYVEPCVFGEGKGYYDNSGKLAFGLMYHGITYADEAYSPETEGKQTVRLWYPVMENGVIEYTRPEACPIHRATHNMEIQQFIGGGESA